MKTAQDGGKAPAAFTPGKYTWYSFLLRGRVDPRSLVRTEGLCHWKIPTVWSVLNINDVSGLNDS